MAYLQKISLILGFALACSWTNADNAVQTYQTLQQLQNNLRDAYIYALIVDVDSRAHDQRNSKLDAIKVLAKTLYQAEFIDKEQGQELDLRIRLYLRSARNEANTYDERLGSRTFNNGYSAYSEGIEQIKLIMTHLEQGHKIPRNIKTSYVLLNYIAMSVEIHSERVIKTERFESLSQASIDIMCDKINHQLSALKSLPSEKTMVKRAMSKWSIIKTPVCNLDKTSAPYTVVYYGGLMIDILQGVDGEVKGA